MNQPKTYREARRKLNQIEAWFRENEHRFSPLDRVVFRTLFEDVYPPAQTVTLVAHLRTLILPANQTQPKDVTNGAAADL